MDRRGFLGLVGRVSLVGFVPRMAHLAYPAYPAQPDLAALERSRVITAATRYLKDSPVTITASSSPRSAGGRHDFFSEADYWWPDPENPKGPYIQRDGMTNPDNFVEHRRAMVLADASSESVVRGSDVPGAAVSRSVEDAAG